MDHEHWRHAPLTVVPRHLDLVPALLDLRFEEPDVRDRLSVIELGDHGRLTIDRPFEPISTLVPTWEGRGHLRPRRRTGRSIAVTIEVAAWSATKAQLRLSPVALRPLRWGDRRLRRYFDLGHLAADELVRRLEAVAGQAVRHHTVEASGSQRRVVSASPANQTVSTAA